jgi:hypothetical protein
MYPVETKPNVAIKWRYTELREEIGATLLGGAQDY